MKPGNAIELENVTKEYRVYQRAFATLKAQTMHVARRLLHREARTGYTIRRALDNISLEIPEGQTVALVGHNGSGKSTMLSILSRIYLPTEGEVRIRGKVSSLLELGVGFNHELTGIENVFFACTLRGLSREETRDRYESIKSFAELGDETLSLPMRMYSSGMESRLAFSVAINMESDVLLIDEALAVGDVRFQEKCLGELYKAKEQGKTIVMVTHDANAAKRFSERAIWLSAGKVVADGPSSQIIDAYKEHMVGAKG